MTGQLLTTTGLMLDLAAVLLLAFYGFPPSHDPLGRDLIETGSIDLQQVARASRSKQLSWLGIIVICVGLLLQVAGAWA